MGNPRLPDQLKEKLGSLNKSRVIPDQMTVVPCKIPVAPKDLTADEREVWTFYRKVMQPLDVIADGDLLAFRMLAVSVARCLRLFKTEGVELKELNAASKEARTWMTAFGLTPQSRSTIRKIVGDKPMDELEEFLGELN